VRWGGDEFVLLLANTGSAAAAAAAEEIRAAVQDLAREAGLDCTVSAGTAGIVPQAKVDNTLFETADSAMYQAKRAGGNRVVLVPVVGDEAAYGSWSPIA
jgi:diguanylate cyclase (GGDEF)-like protein